MSDTEERPTSPHSPTRIVLDFTLMCVLFALNRGAVNVALVSAAPRFEALGNVSNALLYLGYVLVAMTLASRICQKLGPKFSLLAGLSAGCIYMASFYLAVLIPAASGPFVIAGALLGGFASGEVWVAQGCYFARSVEHYASVAHIAPEVGSGRLGGIFAAIFVLFEVVLTASSTALLRVMTLEVLFLLMTIIAVAAAVVAWLLLLNLPPLVPPPERPADARMIDDALAALRMLARNRKMQLLYPFCIAFGFVDALTVNYLGTLASLATTPDSVGVFQSIPPLAAFVASPILAIVAEKLGKGPLLTFGGIMMLGCGAVLTLNTESGLISWGWSLSLVFVVEGIARGVFEATTRGVFGDFFPNEIEPAYANLIISSGTATVIASFLFIRGLLPQFVIGLVTSIATVLGLFASVFAFRLQAEEKSHAAMDKPLLNSQEIAAANTDGSYISLSPEAVKASKTEVR